MLEPKAQRRSRAWQWISGAWQEFALGALLLVGLFWIGGRNYLLFHSLAEMFSIVIAFTIFVLTWNARSLLNNGYLLFLGISFLFVGGLDLVHTLAFRGMGVFPGTMPGDPEAPNLATQLWLAARYMQSITLVLAPLFQRRWYKPYAVVAGFAAVSALLLLSILSWHIFPDAYTTQLTPFKITSEYIIIAFYFVGILLLLGIRGAFDPEVTRLLIACIAVNGMAEFAFTEYLNTNDFFNLFGHFLKIVSFYLIYKAIVETGFRKPHELLFRELQQSEARERARAKQMEAIMDAVPAIVRIAHDPESKRVTTNQTGINLLGLARESENGGAAGQYQVYDLSGQELFPPDRILQRAARTGLPVRDFEETAVFADGSERHLYGNAAPLFTETGQAAGAVAALIDITERVNAEQALQESEARYRGLFESMAEAFSLHEIIYDADGQPVDYRILEVNPAFENLTGLSREQVIGKCIRELVPNVNREWIDREARVVETGVSMRFDDYSTLVDKYFEVLVYPAGERQVATLSVDVTERYRSQRALKESEARLRRLVDSNIIGIIYSDAEGRIAVANDAYLDIIGYSRADLESGQINWRAITPPEYYPVDEKGVEEANTRGACTPYEKEYIRKDGSRVPVLLGYAFFQGAPSPYIAFVLDLSDQKAAEAAAATAAQVAERAAEAAEKSAAESREYAGRLEQTNVRLGAANRELERANRELNDFAFVASHDLQEPLRKIQAFGERVKVNLSGRIEDETQDYLDRMLNASTRMRNMINDLLALSRVTTRAQPFKMVDLNEIAMDVLSDVEMRVQAAGGTVEISDLPVVQGDPMQLHQLLQNLIVNAVKFHKQDVPPKVSVYSDCTSEQQSVRIIVEDNGIGFEELYVERIFQPFQRLHGFSQYEGSGMGLAICRKIVERHGGLITVHSQPDQGSTFIVTLPRSSAASSQAGPEKEA